MNNTTIKEQLHGYLEIADAKKLRAIYTMVQDEIDATQIIYTTEEKREMERRVKHYLNGGEMVSAQAMNKRIKAHRDKRK